MSNHISAILWKQCKDTFKNKTILIQFVMFPFMTVIMENAIEIPGMQEHFFANLFAIFSQYCSMMLYFLIIPYLVEVCLALTSAIANFFRWRGKIG